MADVLCLLCVCLSSKVVPATAIPDGWLGLDNGPDSTAMIQKELADAKTIIWNGPMGVFEFDKFSRGKPTSTPHGHFLRRWRLSLDR